MFKRFPINPILLREVRGTMWVSQAFWLLAGFIGLISGPTLLVYASEFVNSPTGVGQQSDLGQTIFLILVMAAILALIFIPTVKAAASIAGERERKTFDLLLTSQLPATTIIFGKMLATLAYCALLLFAMTPLVAMTFLIGGVDLGTLLITYFIIVAHVVLHTSIGIYWSARFATTTVAIGASLASIIGGLLVVPGIVYVLVLLINETIAADSLTGFLHFLLLASNPFVVVVSAIEAIRMQQTWLVTVFISGQSIALPALWIWSLLGCWLVSIALLYAAIRTIRTHYTPMTPQKPTKEGA